MSLTGFLRTCALVMVCLLLAVGFVLVDGCAAPAPSGGNTNDNAMNGNGSDDGNTNDNSEQTPGQDVTNDNGDGTGDGGGDTPGNDNGSDTPVISGNDNNNDNGSGGGSTSGSTDGLIDPNTCGTRNARSLPVAGSFVELSLDFNIAVARGDNGLGDILRAVYGCDETLQTANLIMETGADGEIVAQYSRFEIGGVETIRGPFSATGTRLVLDNGCLTFLPPEGEEVDPELLCDDAAAVVISMNGLGVSDDEYICVNVDGGRCIDCSQADGVWTFDTDLTGTYTALGSIANVSQVSCEGTTGTFAIGRGDKAVVQGQSIIEFRLLPDFESELQANGNIRR